MIVLALDTSAVTAAAALTDGETLIAQASLDGAKTHSETLLPMVAQMCELSHITPDDVDLYACSVGPGSFTGIRIGVSVLKGLAFGRNKPCVALSALDVLAENLCGTPDTLICPVMDARRGHFYNALYLNGEKQTPDRLISADDLHAELLQRQLPVCLLGDGAAALSVLWKNESFLRPVPPLLIRPNGYAAALCALKMFGRNTGVCTDASLAPVYLRPTQAERELQEKNG